MEERIVSPTDLVRDLAIYIITEGRPEELSRLFGSISASSWLPNRILVLTENIDILEASGFRVFRAWLDKRGVLTDIVHVENDKAPGLSAKKNIALNILRRGGYEYALSIDDDVVLEPYTIQNLGMAISQHKDVYAVGPVIRTKNNRGIPPTKETKDTRIGWVDDDKTWHWGGFNQGLEFSGQKRNDIRVDHLAMCYLHRLDDRKYDPAFDRPIYFMHESDFVYGTDCLVIPKAVIHHWPASGNLTSKRERNEKDITANIQYFAAKHGLGEVTSVDWTGYVSS